MSSITMPLTRVKVTGKPAHYEFLVRLAIFNRPAFPFAIALRMSIVIYRVNDNGKFIFVAPVIRPFNFYYLLR